MAWTSRADTERALRILLGAAWGLALAACTAVPAQLQLPTPSVGDAGRTGSIHRRGAHLPDAGPEPSGSVFPGTDRFTDTPQPRPAAAEAVPRDGVTLNLVGATPAEAAKTILGDLLRVNYLVSERVKGTITIQTSRPVSRDAVLDIFEAVLRAEGAAIVVDRNIYKVLPIEEALAGGAQMLPRGATGRNTAGLVTQIVPLRFVAAGEMDRILRSVAPQLIVLRVDSARNQLIIAGSRNEISSATEAVSVFDVDWMRGMSFGIFPVETGNPEAVAQELDTIFANDSDGPTKGIVRFVPNRRLKSVLVISSRAEFLEKARQWIQRIETAGQATAKQVYVYQVRNRPAVELSVLLQRVYTSQEQSRPGVGLLRPAAGAAASGVPAGPGPLVPAPVPLPAGPMIRGALPGGTEVAAAGAEPVPLETAAAPEVVAGGSSTGISVVADETNNSLVITATPAEYRRVRQVLESIDIAANQVLLEATIAEVTLNDQLKFGLRWFFERGQSQFRLTEFGTVPDSIVLPSDGIVSPMLSGFSYFLNTPNVKVALNALAEITDVNVVSSPSLMVLDNKRAVLQVGDEVPIIVQQAAGGLNGFPIVNSVTLRNTGVILGITPRIGEDGRVLLDIEQEVSDAVRTTTSDIDSPTIQQRRIKTTVVVRNGESIVLAGMMQDRSTLSRAQVPILGSIPVVGNLFKQKDDRIQRTELLIAITPRVVKDAHQSRAITEEFRDKLNFVTRPQRYGPPDRREQLDRLAR